MERREFLRLVGAGAVTVVASSVPQVSIAGSSSRDSLRVEYRTHWSARGVDARRLDADASGELGNGVRLTVFGFAPSDQNWRGRAALDVHFGAVTPAAVFHAWSIRDSAMAGLPAANSFRVPLAEGRLRLDVSWGEAVSPVELSARPLSGAPGLRRGVYLLSQRDRPALVVGVDARDAAPCAVAPWRMSHV